MEYLEVVIKSIVAFSIMNVWLVRSSKETPFRGGNARSMKEEFSAYGLAPWTMTLVGTLKVVLSILLIASIWAPSLEILAAGGLALMMAGAVAMHFRIGDPVVKFVPAATFLLLSAFIIWV